MHRAKTKSVLSKVSARFKLLKDVEKYPCPDDAKEETCFEGDIEVTTYDGQMAHLQVRKIECVRDASLWEGGRVDVVDCRPFLTGELDMGSETF